ncbi:hypothetical protein LTR66_010809 [Elasticomyces elasticus]|nr:hypothetical protein LTR66_010809 [Elasticomyces elasticus]KAK5002850.1 hypothetical protein LTR28_010910 [Elasticomyces elasticus]
MPSQRRIKVFGLLTLLTILVILYVTSAARQTENSEFYTRTVAALEDKTARERQAEVHKAKADAEAAEAKAAAVAKPLVPPPDSGPLAPGSQEALKEVAKDVAGKAQELAGAAKDAVTGNGEKSVAGRKMMKDEKATKDDGVAKVRNTGVKPSAAVKDEKGSESDADHEVEVELNSILKKSPIIIFSKSYCPYSKKAKHILLDQYKIVPAPYVVELDQHPLGQGLQSALQKSTGRRTVPNVLINGKSIGGGDDVQKLHEDGTLTETVKSMGGKRIMEAGPVGEKVAVMFRS